MYSVPGGAKKKKKVFVRVPVEKLNFLEITDF